VTDAATALRTAAVEVGSSLPLADFNALVSMVDERGRGAEFAGTSSSGARE